MGHVEIDERVAALDEARVGHGFKGTPPDAAGLTVGELTAQRRNLFDGGFPTPVLALSAEALAHNLDLLRRYTAAHGLAFAPHGKTSMAPALFARQLAHGAWGISLAVPHQVRVAREFGVRRIFVANEIVDAAALRWLGRELDADPSFEFLCYVDSVRGVELMTAALRDAGVRRALDVVVELGGGAGARTGVRTAEEALAVAEAVTATGGTLRLVGVAGYEGEVPSAAPESVRDYLRRLVGLAQTLDGRGLFGDAGTIVVSAGGSAWFDAVAEVLADVPPLSRPVLKLLRSGAYVTHDDDHYARVTPFNRVPAEGALEPAFRLWAQVVSRPEPGQAFLNAGKRDAPYDLGLPTVMAVRSARDGVVRPAPDGVRVIRLSDQHMWVKLPADAEAGAEAGVEVGDWLGLGLSHPCTTFDKWTLIPEVRADGEVVGYVRTFF